MSDAPSSNVVISTDVNGQFRGVSLRRSALIAAIETGGESWTQPLLLHGPDTATDLKGLASETKAGTSWTEVNSFRYFRSRALRDDRFHELETRFDRRLYERSSQQVRQLIQDISSGRTDPNDVISLVLQGSAGHVSYLDPHLPDDFVEAVDKLCRASGLIMPWQMRDSVLPIFVLAVWRKQPRLHPLILHNPRAVSIPGGALDVQTSSIAFSELSEEVSRVFDLTSDDIEKGYRVWQLSRSDQNEKAHATTPKRVALDTANAFLTVLTRARKADIARAIYQKPAPLILELGDSSISLKHDLIAKDNGAVIRSSLNTLSRRLSRLQHDIQIENVVPSSKDIIKTLSCIIERMLGDEFSDADVVEFGLEINAFQWHIDAVRANLSDTSIGELIGLFATSNLFLGRFPVWLDYTGSSSPAGTEDDGVAAFKLARALLQAAHQKPFLTPEASSRIQEILNRAPEDASAPAIQEGVVRSGENLAAVTADGMSRALGREASEFASKVKEKAFEEASKEIVSWSLKNAPELIRLGQMRQWPWLQWLQHLFNA